MWIMLNDSMLSIVEKPHQSPDTLTVRARIPGDIEAVFGGAWPVTESADTDYRFRAVVPREVVACAIAARIKGIDYPNFKSSIKDHARHAVYLRVWGVLAGWQETARGRLSAALKMPRTRIRQRGPRDVGGK